MRPKCDCLFIRRTCAAELIRQCTGVSVSSKCDKGTVSNVADEDTVRMRGLFNFHKILAGTIRLMMQQCTFLWLILQLVLLIVLPLSGAFADPIT